MLDDTLLTALGADEVGALAAVIVLAAAGVAITPVGVEGRSGEEILPPPRPLERTQGGLETGTKTARVPEDS